MVIKVFILGTFAIFLLGLISKAFGEIYYSLWENEKLRRITENFFKICSTISLGFSGIGLVILIIFILSKTI